MPLVKLEIPDDLLDKARKLADEMEVSVEEFIVSVLIDHISMHRRIERLQKNPGVASKENFFEALAKSPDVEPEPNDRMR